MQTSDIAGFIARALLLVPALTVHEFAHAWTANSFGDSTPRVNGRLTLNPLAHLDPIGSLMVIIAGFGWAKPVPVNPYALRQHSRSAFMWVSFAGPLSNFLMAVLAALPFQLNLISLNDLFAATSIQRTSLFPSLVELLFYFIYINLALGLFNLIPIPPLDGDKILQFFLPDSWQDAMASIRPYGPMILIFLFVLGPQIGLDVLGWIIDRPLSLMLRLLMGL